MSKIHDKEYEATLCYEDFHKSYTDDEGKTKRLAQHHNGVYKVMRLNNRSKLVEVICCFPTLVDTVSFFASLDKITLQQKLKKFKVREWNITRSFCNATNSVKHSLRVLHGKKV